MKDWFARNDETISNWMYYILFGIFVLSIVDALFVTKLYSEAIAWCCALVWLNQSHRWHELAREQDALLTRIFDKSRRNGEKWKKEIETRKDGEE